MDHQKWWSNNTVALVTGSNKGIGLEIVRGLAKSGLKTILTARNEERGQSAVSLLKTEGLQNIGFHQLEVSDLKSVEDCAKWVEKQYGGLDILVNNAAIVSRDYSDKKAGARDVIYTNYYGAKNVTKEFFRLIRDGGRIVNVSSELGQIQMLRSEDLKKELSTGERISEKEIDAFARKFLEAVNKGKNIVEQDWPSYMADYCVSKIALNAYTRHLAFQANASNKNIYINCFSPGYTKTDMTRGMGIKTAEDGADTGIWLALLPPSPDHPSGKFFANRKQISF